jgi:hypothetical protein
MVDFIGQRHPVFAPQAGLALDSGVHHRVGRLQDVGAGLDAAVGQQLPIVEDDALGTARTDVDSHG